MTLLSLAHQAAVKAQRAKLWTRPFTVETPGPYTGGQYYDEPRSGATVTTGLSGDWVWMDEISRRGSPGGVFATADLILNTDIVHSGALVEGGRIVVGGIRCAIKGLSSYQESGEIVLAAVRV